MADSEGDRVASSVEWPPSFIDLYRTRWAPMVRLARLLTAADPSAEELVQDAFLKVRVRWETIENPPSYLRACVVNACRNHHRRRRFERRQHPAPESAEDDRSELREALRALPARQRSAVVLRYYEDLPEAEIAELLGCSVSAVKSLLHRAVKDLRKVVER